MSKINQIKPSVRHQLRGNQGPRKIAQGLRAPLVPLTAALLSVTLLAACGGQTKTVTTTTTATTAIAPSGPAPATTNAKGLHLWRISSPGMVPTLQVDAAVVTESSQTTPALGQIIVFHPPHGADFDNPVCGNPRQGGQGGTNAQACDTPTPQESTQTFIKRVVGVPGDTIKIVNGMVYRNGVLEKEPFPIECGDTPSCDFGNPIKIPPGYYFVLGDNRGASDDSRFWGPVPHSYIIGVVVACRPATSHCTG